MLTCITYVCSRSYEVCWLASPMCVLDLMKYADLHHPCSRSYELCWLVSTMCALGVSPELPWHMSFVFNMLEHTLVMQVSILKIKSHLQVSILEWSILIEPMGDACPHTFIKYWTQIFEFWNILLDMGYYVATWFCKFRKNDFAH